MNSIDTQFHINSNTPKTKFVLFHKKRNISFLNSKRKKKFGRLLFIRRKVQKLK